MQLQGRELTITLVTQDTRGGVQPYAALAAQLREAGHRVRAVAPADYAWLFEQAGVECLALAGMSSERVREIALSTQGHPGGGLLAASRAIAALVPQWAREVLDFADGSDAISGGVGGALLGVEVARRLGVTWVPAHLQPIGRLSTGRPGVFAPGLPRLGGLGDLTGQALTEAAIHVPFLPLRRAARRALGHGPGGGGGGGGGVGGGGGGGGRRGGGGRPSRGTVYGFSRHVVPMRTRRPEDLVSGYWFGDPGMAVLSDGLEEFLRARPERPVVSVGFGSMHVADPDAFARLVIGAAEAAGARLVLIGGAGLASEEARDDDVYGIPAVAHQALFPRLSANVHHGGAGTSASAFAAGVPAVVVPFGADQPFWAKQAHDLGVAPAPIPMRKLTEAALATAIGAALTDESMRRRAAELGARLAAEDGARAAAAWYGTLDL